MADKEHYRVDLSKLDKYLEENTKTVKCPFCDSEDWSIPTIGKIAINAIPWGAVDGNMYATGLPTLTMVCKGCNFVRMMSLHMPDVQDILAEVSDDT